MYTLIGKLDTRAFRVAWMLEEVGAEYELIKAAPRTDEAFAHHPSGKVPALSVDGRSIIDSSAILSFLADRHGQFTFECGTIERAQQDGWLHLVNDEIDQVLWTAARHSFVLPKEKRVPDVKESLKWEYARNLDRIMDKMEGDYLMGEKPTVPDFVLAHCSGWAKAAGFPTENEKYAAYSKRMKSRPAFGRVVDMMKG